MQKEILNIDEKGLIKLPLWAWKALVKMSGIRSKRYRIQKKAVKREFTKLLEEAFRAP